MKEIVLTKENFKKQTIDSEIPVMVDFWASWCGPCRMIAPTVEQIADEFDGKIKVGKINVDEQAELAAEYKIEVIPTLMFFKNGKAVKQTVGLMTKEEIIDIIKEL